MGGLCSKPNALSQLDDSIRVAVKHDAKAAAKKGETLKYVPRQPHPLLDRPPNKSGGEQVEESKD